MTTSTPTPFHAGELQVQRRTGEDSRARIHGRIVATQIPDAARAFISQQDLVVLGTEDVRGDLWATLITGAPGFAAVDDDLKALEISLEDPERMLANYPSLSSLQADAPMALLFIELATRRRLRVNGVLRQADRTALSLQVEQAYPACPRYIQKREVDQAVSVHPPAPASGAGVSDALLALMAQADTLFIATAGADGLLDVSHRGGEPGFAQWRDGTLNIPDFPGNSMFNTLGNLALDQRAGLCIPDFPRGCQWMLTGEAEGRFDVAEQAAATGGTRRWIRFVPQAWSLQPLNRARSWTLVEHSPWNPVPA